MRNILVSVILCLISLNALAQAPEKMSYQAVVRDNANLLVADKVVGMRISIVRGSVTGTPDYVETQSPRSNINGLVTLEIGAGTVVSGSFAGLNWSSGPYFIQTEIDPSGGSNYSILGLSQLVSVPYALYAKTSGSSTPGPAGPAGSIGATGPIGPAGVAGAAGTNGPAGVAGPQGAKGDTGATGPIGLAGAAGAAGTNGTAGATGPQGAKGDTGPTGATGAAGPQGATSSQGAKGDTGASGPIGPAGVAGAQGTNGPAGATGPLGAKGDTGATGPLGPAGANGTNGAIGATGAIGPAPSGTGIVTVISGTLETPSGLTGDVTTTGAGLATTIGTGKVTNTMLAGSIDLTSKVTGILPSSNGGTGNGFTTITGPTTSLKTFTLPDASATILTSNAAVSVAQGGTGHTSYADGELLIGNTTGNTLTKATLTQGTGISITNASGAITIASTATAVPSGTADGDMLYWKGGAWVKVAAGTNGQTLSLVGIIPVWQKPAIPSMGSTDVYNHKTGKVWMDRDLGASQVAISSTDVASYGDLYQWGRGSDGHQIITSGTTTGPIQSPWSSTFFITISASPSDWRSPQDGSLWQGVNGVNNPCPSGYRIPTAAEWTAEHSSWGSSSQNAAGAFASPLKLPIAGYRNANGSLFNNGSSGLYWSSTVSDAGARGLDFNSSNAFMATYIRVNGFSVRCIKD